MSADLRLAIMIAGIGCAMVSAVGIVGLTVPVALPASTVTIGGSLTITSAIFLSMAITLIVERIVVIDGGLQPPP